MLHAIRYSSILSIFLHAALPDNQKNELCYRYERFKMLLKEQKDIIKKKE